jgi:MoxR-like ATPase
MSLLKVRLGAGPRASQNLIVAAKAHAAFNGKFSWYEDVKAVATGILRHRIIKIIKRMPKELLRKWSLQN